jgi:hypothetical protein
MRSRILRFYIYIYIYIYGALSALPGRSSGVEVAADAKLVKETGNVY